MAIEFQDMARPVEANEAILLAGEKIGEVKRCPFGHMPGGWHAVISVQPGAAGLVQGFADTKEKAVLTAFTNGEAIMQNNLRALRVMMEKAYGGR